jgi:hypothetical protein
LFSIESDIDKTSLRAVSAPLNGPEKPQIGISYQCNSEVDGGFQRHNRQGNRMNEDQVTISRRRLPLLE